MPIVICGTYQCANLIGISRVMNVRNNKSRFSPHFPALTLAIVKAILHSVV